MTQIDKDRLYDAKSSSNIWKVFTVALGLLLLLSMQRCRVNEQSLSVARQEKEIFEQKSKEWIDKEGNYHSTIKNLEVDRKVLAQQVDNLATQLEIKPKQVSSYSRFRDSIYIDKLLTLTDTLYALDSSIIRRYKYSDKWIDVNVMLAEEDAEFKLKGWDTVQIVEYWKRKWFLGDKTYFTDVSNKNPYVKLSGLKTITQSKAKPMFLFGPSLSTGYNGQSIQTIVGVSLMYYPLTFKIYRHKK